MHKQNGFTIVELLIVIVVIAILAAISVVAYTGIQQRAQDTSLKSDLAQAGKQVKLWMTEHSNQELRTLYGGRTAAWIVGDNADNDLSDTHLRWRSISELPEIRVGPTTTMEVIAQYGGTNAEAAPGINERLLEKNQYCITGAVKNGSYNYRPMSGIREQYDKMLFFDSALSRVATMNELGQAHDNGLEISCEAHLQLWRQAVS